MHYRLAVERLVASISSRLIKSTVDEIDDALCYCLKEIGEFIQVDRTYIHLLSPECVIIHSYGWQHPESPAVMGALVGLDLSPLNWVMNRLKGGEQAIIPRMADLPPEAAAEKATWQGLGVLSTTAIPFILEGSLVGFFGFSSLRGERQWNGTELRILRLVGEILLSAIARKRADEARLASEAHYRVIAEQAQAKLEARVAERTAELAAALRRLEKEAADRKALEDALGESEVRYRKLVETVPMSITITNLEGKIIWANPYALKLHGLSSMEEMLGKSAFDLIAPEDRQRAIENTRITMEIGGIREIEYNVLRKDGSSFPAKVSAALIPGSEGQPQAFIGLVWDISEFKQAQAELELSRLRYQAISELITDNAYVLRVDPDGSITREWMLDRVTREMGYSPEELDKIGWNNLLHPEDINLAGAHLRRVVAGKADAVDFRIVGKDGSVRWLRNYARPAWDDAEGRVVRIYGAAQDITEQLKAEEAYHTLVNQSLQGLVIFQRDRVAFANPAVETMTGYKPEEILKMRLTDLAQHLQPARKQGQLPQAGAGNRLRQN